MSDLRAENSDTPGFAGKSRWLPAEEKNTMTSLIRRADLLSRSGKANLLGLLARQLARFWRETASEEAEEHGGPQTAAKPTPLANVQEF